MRRRPRGTRAKASRRVTRELEAGLAHAADRDDGLSRRIRQHFQPLVDVRRGRLVLSAGELAEHQAGAEAVIRELGASVSSIQTTVGEVLQQRVQRSRRHEFGGDEIEGSA